MELINQAAAPLVSTSLASQQRAVVGRYELLRLVGRGGFGVVYQARDPELGRHVAVKLVRPDRLDADRSDRVSLLDLFRNEAAAAAKLNHPNIVTIHDYGTQDGLPYLVLELLTGVTLADDLEHGSLGCAEALEVFTQICRGLVHAHAAGIIHCDLKPGNVFLRDDGLVKLLDFGLARVRQALTAFAGSQAGVQGGTPAYMAPEQWRGAPQDERTDIFACGLILFEMLCGDRAFAVTEDSRDPPKSVTDRSSPGARMSGVPHDLVAITERALAFNPEDRFQSAQQLLEAVLPLVRAGAVVADTAPYRYLEHFTQRDADWFFGRERDNARLTQLLETRSFVALVGPPGAGKSSLVHAGLLPRLRRAGEWLFITLRPGSEPLRLLHERLVEACGEARVLALLPDPESLVTSPGRMGQVLRTHARATGVRVLVFIDQLEELATHAHSGRTRRAFAQTVLAAADDASGPVRVVVALRDDFIARLSKNGELRNTLARNLVVLGPPDAAELEEVVRGPAARLGYEFEPGLVEEMVAAVADEQAPLPLLQLAASRLWERRDVAGRGIPRAGLAAVGGVSGVLATHANEVLRGLLGTEEIALARHILCSLVNEDGTRRQAGRDELVRRTSDPELAARALERLILGRLVTVFHGTRGEQLELAHESLITGWDQLREWLEGDRSVRAFQERLSAAANDWHRLGRRGDGLWVGRQLTGVGATDHLHLAALEKAFLRASRIAWQRRRILRIALPLAVVAAVGVAIAATRIRARAEVAATAARSVEEARRHHRDAQRQDADALQRRARAFLLFDQGSGFLTAAAEKDSWNAAESEWSRVRELEARASSGYARASAAFEAALIVDPDHPQAREELTRLIAVRLALAERMHQADLEVELSERLAGLLAAGAAPSLVGTKSAVLTVRRNHPDLAVSIARYAASADGRLILGEAQPFAGEELELPPGSYLLTAQAEGRAQLRLPVLLDRGEHRTLALDAPRASAVPPGFVFVPAGDSLVGTEDEVLRSGLDVAPMHPVSVASFFIGRFEVTFAEYIEWLDTLPPVERARRTPRNESQPGAIELRLGRDKRWQLALRPITEELHAAWGEPIHYSGRAERAVQDWRRFPVTGTSFENAVAFAEWLRQSGRIKGARLCREEEWERAARGADGRIFTTGRQLLPSDANIDLTYGGIKLAFGPDEVGSHPQSASPFGVEDLHGNADEMVAAGRYGETTALRGGSWYTELVQQRLDARFRNVESTRHMLMGFRLCADARAHRLPVAP